MEPPAVKVEVEDGRAWTYMQRSIDEVSKVPLHTILRWVVEQINFGCFTLHSDGTGEAVTLVLGKDSARALAEPLMENACEEARTRCLAVNLAGLFAEAREAGIEPKHEALAESVRFQATDNPEGFAGVWMNTEFHYAFRFIDLLSGIQDKMFAFSSPPIHGVLPDRVSDLLREATRAHLYELNDSSVAMCRALLEESLKARIDSEELFRETIAARRGEFECLINLAARKQLLTKHASHLSHSIRKLGNKVMHDSLAMTDTEASQALLNTRFILEELVSVGQP